MKTAIVQPLFIQQSLISPAELTQTSSGSRCRCALPNRSRRCWRPRQILKATRPHTRSGTAPVAVTTLRHPALLLGIHGRDAFRPVARPLRLGECVVRRHVTQAALALRLSSLDCLLAVGAVYDAHVLRWPTRCTGYKKHLQLLHPGVSAKEHLLCPYQTKTYL